MQRRLRGCGDLTITWVRGTRLGGDWSDGSGAVPLAETAEAYEVDVLSGATVVPTLAASSPSALYSAAEPDRGLRRPPGQRQRARLSAQRGRRPRLPCGGDPVTETPNLAISHIAASQNQKEVTANEAFASTAPSPTPSSST